MSVAGVEEENTAISFYLNSWSQNASLYCLSSSDMVIWPATVGVNSEKRKKHKAHISEVKR